MPPRIRVKQPRPDGEGMFATVTATVCCTPAQSTRRKTVRAMRTATFASSPACWAWGEQRCSQGPGADLSVSSSTVARVCRDENAKMFMRQTVLPRAVFQGPSRLSPSLGGQFVHGFCASEGCKLVKHWRSWQPCCWAKLPSRPLWLWRRPSAAVCSTADRRWHGMG